MRRYSSVAHGRDGAVYLPHPIFSCYPLAARAGFSPYETAQNMFFFCAWLAHKFFFDVWLDDPAVITYLEPRNRVEALQHSSNPLFLRTLRNQGSPCHSLHRTPSFFGNTALSRGVVCKLCTHRRATNVPKHKKLQPFQIG